MKNDPVIKIINSLESTADPNPYVLAIDEDDDPYNIEDLVTITAKDSNGADLTDQIVYDSDSVDWTKPGDYPVEVSVMDNDLNLTTVFFTVHVITRKEAKDIENGHDSRNTENSRSAAREKKLIKRDAIIDKVFYILLGLVALGLIVYTYMDTF